MDSFLINALLGGLGVALMTGPLGTFIVWQRMAYFGDTIAHSALLGVVLSLIFSLHLTAGIVLVAVGVAGLLVWLSRGSRFSPDTILGILAHGTLSIGIVLIALTQRTGVDLNAYLFGDILAVSHTDIAIIYAAAILCLALISFNWRKLVLLAINPEIAQVEGANPERYRLLLMFMIALVVAISIKVVGILLITSLLIIPAATARYFAHTPPQMALIATFFGALAVIMGLSGSYFYDTPAGPTIVVGAFAVFVLVSLLRMRLAGV